MVLRHFKFAVLAALFLGCTSFDWNSNPNDENFSLKGSGKFTDERDGKTYKTIIIGEQTWMAENLNYDTGGKCYGEGGKVTVDNDECFDYGCSSTKEIMLTSEEIQANCAKYGRLYNWATAMDLPSSCNSNACASQIADKRQGICPSGWHIPSATEWLGLAKFAGDTDYFNGQGEVEEAGKVLKAKNGWVYDDYFGKSGNGTNNYGFSALPGGHAYSSGNNISFSWVGLQGIWWSASEVDTEYSGHEMAYSQFIKNQYNSVFSSTDTKSYLYSVRCLQD